MPSVAQRQAVVRQHLDSENAHQLSETLETLTSDCVFEDVALGERITGHAGAAAYSQRWWRAFPDLKWIPRRLAFTDEGLVSELIARGTHRGELFGFAPTGQAIELPVASFVSFADGRMSRERFCYDLTTLLRQLGATAIPPELLRDRADAGQ